MGSNPESQCLVRRGEALACCQEDLFAVSAEPRCPFLTTVRQNLGHSRVLSRLKFNQKQLIPFST